MRLVDQGMATFYTDRLGITVSVSWDHLEVWQGAYGWAAQGMRRGDTEARAFATWYLLRRLDANARTGSFALEYVIFRNSTD